MSIKRERQITQEAYASLPVMIRENIVGSESLKYFADAMSITNSQLPSLNEMTIAGSARAFSPVSPFNGSTGLGLCLSSDIPLNTLDLMRRDNKVALGMAIVKFPISTLNYTINCESPMIKEFIRINLIDKWADLIKDSLKALDFGFAAFEKVWNNETISFDPGSSQRKIRNRNFIVLKKVKPIHPSTLSVRIDGKGNFAGINQDSFGERIIIPRNKSMIITNDEEYGNFFGKSRMVAAYESWYWKQVTTQFFLRYTERFSIPPYKVNYPNGITRFADGSQADNAVIAMKIAEAISSHGNIAVPSTTDDKGNKKWDVDSIMQGRLNMKPDDIVGFWGLQILQGLLIPDKESLDAMDPTTASQVYLSTLAQIVTHIEQKINDELIKPLVLWNFTPEEIVPCRLNIDDIDFQKREEMRKLASKVMDFAATTAKNMGGFPFDKFPDMNKIWDILGVPQVDSKIVIPTSFDSEGNKIKEKKEPKNNGLDKGEQTEGNTARTGRDGTPRDQDKQDDQI